MSSLSLSTARRYLKRNALGLCLAAPALAVIFAVYIYPMLEAARLSLYRYSVLKPARGERFVGADNYIEVFVDGAYWDALQTTGLFLLITISMQMLIGIAAAVALNTDIVRKVLGVTLVRSLLIMPLMASPIVVGLIWAYMLDTDIGFVNQMLRAVGLPAVNWLNEPGLALISVSVALIWQNTSLVILLTLAGLEALPKDPFEAAKVDGATNNQLFFNLTLPMLRPVILVTLLTATIDAYRVFGLILVMTDGGPGSATTVVGMQVYRTGFKFWRTGEAAAESVVTFLVILAIAIIFTRVLRVRHQE